MTKVIKLFPKRLKFKFMKGFEQPRRNGIILRIYFIPRALGLGCIAFFSIITDIEREGGRVVPNNPELEETSFHQY